MAGFFIEIEMSENFNYFENPFAISLKREEETSRLIAHFQIFIKDERIRKSAINHVKKHRHSISNPESTINFISSSEVKNPTPNNLLLSKLIKLSPIYRLNLENLRKYFKYSRKLFEIAGIYSLEDSYVRLYIFSIVWNPYDLKTQKSIEAGLLKVLSPKNLTRLSKDLRRRQLPMGKDALKGLAYLISKARKQDNSYRKIGELLNIDKNTVQKYIFEVEGLPPNEKAEFLMMAVPYELRREYQPEEISEESDTSEYNDE